MFYTKGIDSGKLGNVCCNGLADPNNLRNDDYTQLLSLNPVEHIEFLT